MTSPTQVSDLFAHFPAIVAEMDATSQLMVPRQIH